jgi:sec-independent protein translocase protein TatB
MFGLSIDKIIVLVVIAAFVIGPTRLPGYAAKLATFVTGMKRYADRTMAGIKEELGPEFDDVDWKRLDPRQYDPRRIVRDAIFNDTAPDGESGPAGPAAEAHQIDATEVSHAERPEHPL